ncbi:DUF6192 family protein [Streptomyces sp. NPDC008125]|uniref:DUF6192 family protein n=1 Tax=Streptomyces sp. NPDC008125 TaxID=3364811 RepID=UPI0036F122AC
MRLLFRRLGYFLKRPETTAEVTVVDKARVVGEFTREEQAATSVATNLLRRSWGGRPFLTVRSCFRSMWRWGGTTCRERRFPGARGTGRAPSCSPRGVRPVRRRCPRGRVYAGAAVRENSWATYVHVTGGVS